MFIVLSVTSSYFVSCNTLKIIGTSQKTNRSQFTDQQKELKAKHVSETSLFPFSQNSCNSDGSRGLILHIQLKAANNQMRNIFNPFNYSFTFQLLQNIYSPFSSHIFDTSAIMKEMVKYQKQELNFTHYIPQHRCTDMHNAMQATYIVSTYIVGHIKSSYLSLQIPHLCTYW